ncbi:MAG: hypothetical protein G01um101438_317 [Parcubacteria group bacterium Gr01-1014_38]|nr:MAG: hypothetical protein G01um101438_317 [Parcubacteria group bacterium Gr01-1014_38]
MVNFGSLPRFQQILLGLCAVVTGTVLVLVMAEYASELAASLTQRRFTVSAPKQVRAGETVPVKWGFTDAQGRLQPPSEDNRRRFPAEKLELVHGKKAITLLARAPNTGSARVVIPSTIPKGARVLFRVTGVDSKGRVTLARTQSTDPTLVTAAADTVAQAPGDGGGEGGGGGGGGGGGSGPPPSRPRGFFPIIFSAAHENDAGNNLLVGYQVADPQRNSFRYRLAGERAWRNVRVGSQSHSHLIILWIDNPDPHNPDRPAVRRGTPVEFYFPPENADPENPQRIYRVDICSGNRFCALRPDPPNQQPAPGNLTATIEGTETVGNYLHVRFTTNLPIFLPQVKIEGRRQDAGSWRDVTPFYLTANPTFYREDTTHLGDISDVVRSYHAGTPHELRIVHRHTGQVISNVFRFTSPGDTALRMYVEPGGPFLVQVAKNGVLVRWETNQFATSRIETRSFFEPPQTGPTIEFLDRVLSHAVPLVNPRLPGGTEITASSTNDAGARVTMPGSAHNFFCSRNVNFPPGVPSEAGGCMARVGLGPDAVVDPSRVGPNVPWAIYCRQLENEPRQPCSLCVFPGGNFGAPTCAPIAGDPGGWPP